MAALIYSIKGEKSGRGRLHLCNEVRARGPSFVAEGSKPRFSTAKRASSDGLIAGEKPTSRY
jgi:hypothetical protein